ncbi:MAG: hypothetical protein A2951_01270 [Candidatus Buchananbacteria bacterium RIFCSPLOWO2_01_FULL_56_15]|uniref:DUF4134 domain-containing protein n=2 Tax=Candidatus Buchananiibacteriota TaxID=1817903 RepID=A0A1G1YHM4_9BACT|nr:MAG: hypothetical protein A3J59_04845 [Candidatus Buchananbacteria bacterium RIFCSPHIGHO2_02_FULL_56_16]OGY54645.1 MAG: hypothetical protein A2951_01270 [Candidatus Buchananbacteria bacterium RIFCSPLOWO2_01_FULL_56_15]
MKSLRKKILPAAIGLYLAAALIGPVAASAAFGNITNQMITGLEGNGGEAIALPSGQNTTVETVAGNVIQSFLSVFGILFLGLMVYGGYKWMIAQGREEELKKAKDIIRSSIIGLAIALSAYAISLFVVARFYQAAGGT